MRFSVVVTPEAQDGITAAFLYIHERSPLNAERWLNGLYAQIATLEQFPERCPLALEHLHFDEELRQLLYKSHRIVFMVSKRSQTVYIIYVRHVRQTAVEGGEESE